MGGESSRTEGGAFAIGSSEKRPRSVFEEPQGTL